MRMSTARALWIRDSVNASPAPAAHNAEFADAHRALAYDADLGQQKIREPNRRGANGRAHVRRNGARNKAGDPHYSPPDGLAHGGAIGCNAEPQLERASALT